MCRVDARHCLICHTMFQNIVRCGRDSAVGTATRNGLIGSGIEIPWGPEFPYPARPSARPSQLPCTCTFTYTGSPPPGVKRPTRGFDRPPHLAPRLKKEYGYNSIPPICHHVIMRRILLHKLCYLQTGSKLHWLKLHLVFKLYRVYVKVKGKGRLWVLQHCCLEAYYTLTRMSSFIHLQRRCTHQAA